MKVIPYGCQNISDNDIRSVVDVLKSDWLTQGPAIERFERAVADYCGAKYAVAVNSATSALHIACRAAGIGCGDRSWTSPNSFVASANCALYCEATVDFIDIDPQTYNICADKLEEKLRVSECTGNLPKLVIPVHFAGQSCEMEKISRLSREYGFTIIEDASHAIGGRYRDTRIGCCAYSDMTVFSFHPVKIVTTGEGGMVLTNREDLYEKLQLYRSHGITRNPSLMHSEAHGPWYYEQIDLGYNYRLTDIQAALGTSQMNRLDEFVSRRHYLAQRYDQALKDLPLILPYRDLNAYSALHLYVVQLDEKKTGVTRKQLFEALRKKNILVNVHYTPIHTQPYYREKGFSDGDFPVAESYYASALSIPLYFSLTEEDQDFVMASLKEMLS